VDTFPGYDLLTIIPPTGMSVSLATQLAKCVTKSLTSGSETTTTTTTTLAPTYCYTVTLDGEGYITWLDEFGNLGSYFKEAGVPETISVCAQFDSFFAGDNLVYGACSDFVSPCSCPTTTTTTSSTSTSTSTTTSTTTQEPTTTTSTTTEELTTTTTTTTP